MGTTAPELATDVDFMEAELRSGPKTTMALIGASYAARGVGMTPHSRAADLRRRLRKQGEDVICKPVGYYRRRQVWRYEIVSLAPAVTAETWHEVMEGAAA